MSTVPHTLEPVHFSPQTVYCGDCLDILPHFPANCVDLIYIDPPFNSNRNYEVFWGDVAEKRAFEDRYGDAMEYIKYMRPRVEQLHRVLKPTGSFYYHCDWHASHYIKVMLDEIFGANFFQNEVVWHYRGGGVSKTRYGRKHDTIFFYSKGKRWTFNVDAIREPYSEESLERLRYKAKSFRGDRVYDAYEPNELGKHPDDVFEMQPVMPSAKERLGYPTQKPLRLLERIIKASSNSGDIVLDAFCGCGTALVAAQNLGRRWLGIDISPSSCNVMGGRLENPADLLGCDMRQAPPTMSAEDVALSWNAAARGERAYYRFSNLPQTAEQLRNLPGFEFENWAVLQLGEVLKHQGHHVFAQANRSKVGDLGLDGRIYLVGNVSKPRRGTELPLMEHSGAASGERQPYLPVQVKNKDKASRPDIDEFAHSLERDERDFGFFIAWDFTRDAEQEIQRLHTARSPKYIHPVLVQTLINDTFDLEMLELMG